MNNQQGIYWHQGMFLQPQHFQQAELHTQFQFKPVFEAGLPHFWGVGALALAAAAIANGSVEVQSAQLLFPDRSYIEYPGNAVIASRPFKSEWVDGDKPFTVYLGLKKLARQGVNVTECATLADAAGATTRFVSLDNPADTGDLLSDGPAAQVRSLLYVVSIFFDSEVGTLDGYELIPIARLVRDGETIKLSDSFIPPCYALSGSAVLTGMIKDIRDELSGRARQLQQYKSPREIQKAEFDASNMVFLLALRSLNRATPYLFHLTEAVQVHPWLAYGALRQLIGEMSSFSERVNMLGESEDGTPGLPAYDHADLGKCFERVRRLIGSLLNEITVGPELLAIMDYADGYYSAELQRGFFSQRNRFYLVLRTDAEPQRVIDAMRDDVRLAAREQMPQLLAHALPGLELLHLAQAPQGLPRRANSYYFRIEQMSQQWDEVEREGILSLSWLDAPADLKCEIVVLRR